MAYFNIDSFLNGVIGENGLQRSTQFRCRIPVANIGGGGRMGRFLNRRYPEACTWLAEGLLCEQTRTPSRSFHTESLGIYGLEEKYPMFTTYVDHECQFYTPLVKRGGKYHNDVAALFHEWQNVVQRRTHRHGSDADMILMFPDEYRLQEGMILDQFSTYNEKRRGGLLGVNVNAQGNVRDGIRRFNQVSRWFNGPQIPDRFRWEWGNGEDGDSEETLSYEFFNVFPQTVQSSEVDWAGMNEFQRVTVSFTYSYWHLKQTAAGSQIDVGEQLEWGRFGDEHNLDPNKTNYYMNGR